MGKKVISLSVGESDIESILESCIILDSNDEIAYVDEYEVPYQVEILMSTRKGMNIPDVIEIKGLNQLYDVIDREDCLPDVGLLDYKEEELGLNLKDVTLRELYKEVLNKVL
ncbi:hypothetical protein [Clostridium cadaveris]|uniref:hypothetical protein n=1 Tax=Clostridium cadaveris TaxID=1529 RepID=UPI0004107AE0|nr:hypothetical protein [Clostridium cadaveris]